MRSPSDRERAQGMPISPCCDRETTKLSDAQGGFIEFVVLPSFKVLSELAPTLGTTIVPELERNRELWKAEDA